MRLADPRLLTVCVLTCCGAFGCNRDDAVEAARGGSDATASGAGGKAGADGKLAESRLVQVVPLKPQAVEERLPCTGHIEAFHGVVIVSRARGQVLAVHVEDGRRVTKGEVLFKLDDREASLNVLAAKNREEEAKNRQREAEVAGRETDQRLRLAEQDLDQADRDLARTKRSAEQELASSKALEEVELARARALNALELAKTGKLRAQVALERAGTEVESAKIQRLIQERLLEDYTILAPIDGMINGLTVRGGEWVTPTTGGMSDVGSDRVLCAVTDLNPLVLNLSRPQKELGLLAVGQRVEVQVDAFRDESFIGLIELIAPTVDAQTGTFKARVRLDNKDIRLRPGMFCRAFIVTGQSHDALMIPKEAIVYEADKPFAFVVRDGKAVRIAIERGIELRDELEARNRADLAQPDAFIAGDLVVTVGKDSLERSGTTVKIVKG